MFATLSLPCSVTSNINSDEQRTCASFHFSSLRFVQRQICLNKVPSYCLARELLGILIITPMSRLMVMITVNDHNAYVTISAS